MATTKRYESREYQVSELVRELERQYPLWPSTFSTCECKRGMGRGGGRCAQCIEEELSTFVGRSLAWEIHQSLKDYIRIKAEVIRGTENEQ